MHVNSYLRFTGPIRFRGFHLLIAPLQDMFRIKILIHGVPLNQETQETGQGCDSRQNLKAVVERLRVRVNICSILGRTSRESFERLVKALRVLGNRGRQVSVAKMGGESVLEYRPSNGYADTHSEGSCKGIHDSGVSHVLGLCHGLNGNVEGHQNEAVTETDDD